MKKRKRIIIKEHGSISYIDIDSITHITCYGALSIVYKTNGKSQSSYKRLKQYEEELNDSDFVRVNHNTLVNFGEVKNIRIEKGRKLILNETLEFDISRRKKFRVCEIITKLL